MIIRRSQETGICPSAEAIMTDLRLVLKPGEPVIAVSPTSAPLAYYAQRHSLPPDHFFQPNRLEASHRRAFVILSRDSHSSVADVLQALNLTDTFLHHRQQLWREYPSASVVELIPSGQLP